MSIWSSGRASSARIWAWTSDGGLSVSLFMSLPFAPRCLARRDDAPDLLVPRPVEVGPGVDHHHDLTAHHANSSPPLFMGKWVFLRGGHRIFEDEGGGLKAEAVCSEICLALSPVLGATPVQSFLATLHSSSYAKSAPSTDLSLFADSALPDRSSEARSAGPQR